MLSPELKRLLQVLQWETKKKFSSTKQGLLTMSERGRGLDFKEVRNYHYGDDMRYIDWNVTSRTGELYTKEYYEERDASIIIFYDTSVSLSSSKRTTAFQIALFLSLFHIKMGNRVLLVPFSDHQLAPGKWLRTETDIFLAFAKIAKQENGEGTNYAEAYQFAFRLHPKHAVSYWISDFNDFSNYLKTNKIPKIWEPIGIWIQDEIDTLKFPLWLRMFQKISEENIGFRENENTYQKDLKAAKSFFGVQLVQINPNTKLSQQILPLFKIKRNG
ncbi:DUF58 domain-containing protein [Leptospira kanakyensis]|uniref:DUF58 domain-containing protein n=1 Tax=Leptospira kanakyensis TaxID=2484968 RepID=A0A6N4QPB1_9LEPT|nr:DUF58 domain-containing protein [Leptospira kanakyensis]MCW7470904.1 DUF58 domain-containing protein [Leptospira kanakyensis]MCW7482905.1 DUF58 domain-containing protein [Leptospira kanakyensis]TGK54414.1 DUF58 domain-containing protein [Leptospira kanakyensis]TGK59118.1 DUF58 domain-containing protein [Leptospira kanakyensis]TGK75268.1 DUF58 domain-containing protein [Leptospira kanakyensis]